MPAKGEKSVSRVSLRLGSGPGAWSSKNGWGGGERKEVERERGGRRRKEKKGETECKVLLI